MARRRKKIIRWTGIAAVAFAAVFILSALYANHRLSKLVLGGLGESFSTRIYAAPFILNDSVYQTPEHLIERLRRLGYRSVEDEPATAGEYHWEEPVLAVFMRAFETPHLSQSAALVFLRRLTDNRWALESKEGRELSQAALEPELAAELSGPKKVRREPAEWGEIPPNLVNAVVAVEDKRFWRHFGLDFRAIARALFKTLTGHEVQGGSTITQQVAKNLLLSSQRTLRRKAVEGFLALYLEIRYSKEEIITLYLNHVYWGQDGAVSIAGAKAASKFYFGKSLRHLSVAECAMLAGMIRSPYRYNPRRNLEAAKGRRDFVLKRMNEEESITEEEMLIAVSQPLFLAEAAPVVRDDNAYFSAEVVRELLPRYNEEALFHYGLTIHTTMDPLMQRAAQTAVSGARHQAALVALDPHLGRILALSGGKDFRASQFNRATQALRQPGSAFKPFVYGAALKMGWTPASALLDEARKYPRDSSVFWQPKNFDGIYHGTTTVREALALSMNSATLDLAQKIGPASIVSFARLMGIESPLSADLSIALGSFEVTLLELSSAYAPFANGGFRVKPHLITAVVDAEGKILEMSSFERNPALEPALAYLLSSLLESVVKEGTGRALALWNWNSPSAGKTGTSNRGRDAWFIGYTPYLLAGAWAGEDSDKAVGATGARDAIPIWAGFMKQAGLDYPPDEFGEPQGIKRVTIDSQTGFRAVSGCPQRKEEIFLAGSEPARDCPLHKSGFGGWLKRLFGSK